MKNKKLALEELGEVSFEVDKKAFKPRFLRCSKCNLTMKKRELEIQVGEDIIIRIKGFECGKCGRQYLGLEDSKKLDKAMVLGRALKKDFKMTRNLSFDGDNYTFRIPKEFTHDVSKKKIEIVPLGAKEFCAVIE